MRAARAHRPPATTRRRNWRRRRNWQRQPDAGRRTGPAEAPDLQSAWAPGLREGGRELPVKLGEQRYAVGYATPGVGRNERAYVGGGASGQPSLVRQSMCIGWRQLTTGRRHIIGFCRWGGRAAPPLPRHAISSQPAEELGEARAAFKPRTGCQTHRMRVQVQAWRTSSAPHNP